MLSNRKKMALSAGLLMAASTAIVGAVQPASQSASPASSVPASAARQQAALPISIIPSAIGPGGTVKRSSAAKWAVTVKYGAAKAGWATKLQKKTSSGWSTVAKGKVNAKGYALFAVAVSLSTPVTYRIDGPGVPSASASTGMWGSSEDFVDEFSGTSLNLANWSHRGQALDPLSRRSCAKGDPKAVRVASGSARLSVMVDKSRSDFCKPLKPGGGTFGTFHYRLNANIGTQFKHTMLYGVAAARIKFQPLQGQHASFWLQPDDILTQSTTGHEVDIIEWFGKGTPNGGLTSFVYAPSRLGHKYGIGQAGWIVKPRQYLTSATDDWYKKYHVFTVEWSPSGYVFRIDGQLTGRIPASKITTGAGGTASTPEYPILSILSSDYELKKLPGTAPTKEKKYLPQTMYVDWIRTWQDPAHLPPTP